MAFVLAFDCHYHVTSLSRGSISYLHVKFEHNWSINTKVTFKGCCGLWLAFDCKDHVTSRSWWTISYLHAKFEQNRSINSRDMVFLIFQGYLAFKRLFCSWFYLRHLGTWTGYLFFKSPRNYLGPKLTYCQWVVLNRFGQKFPFPVYRIWLKKLFMVCFLYRSSLKTRLTNWTYSQQLKFLGFAGTLSFFPWL